LRPKLGLERRFVQRPHERQDRTQDCGLFFRAVLGRREQESANQDCYRRQLRLARRPGGPVRDHRRAPVHQHRRQELPGRRRDDTRAVLPGAAAFKSHPTTSAPGPGQFVQVYERLAQEGASEIISIHIGSALSAMVGVARLAAQETERVPVTVFDSGNLSLGTGLLALRKCHEITLSLDLAVGEMV